MPERFDVIVVGGSFAGLSCAAAAAARGLRAAVLERKRDPGDAPRTTGILVKEVAERWDVPLGITRKIHGIRLYSPRLRHVDLERPGYFFLATDTPALLRWLSKLARDSGAEVLAGLEFTGAARRAHDIVIEGHGLETPWLVGADGCHSRVARAFDLGRNTDVLVGIEAEFEGVRGVEEDRLHCFLDPILAPGYLAWVVPGCGVTQVGLAARPPAVPRLEPFLERIASIFDFGSARLVGRRGGPIPVGGLVRPFASPGVLLTGDAAGLVSPLTAGGIHTALEHGRRAGQSIAEFLLDGGPHPAAVLAREYPRFRWKRRLRRALDRILIPALLEAVFSTPPFLAVAKGIFFHHRGVFARDAWKDLAARPPPVGAGAPRGPSSNPCG